MDAANRRIANRSHPPQRCPSAVNHWISGGMDRGVDNAADAEWFSTAVADARGYVYALAWVLYECRTGRSAFPGDTLQQQVAAHLTTGSAKTQSGQPGSACEVLMR